MREHVHLPLNESFDISLAMFLKSVKQETSRQRRGNRNRFWLPRHFDFNVKTPDKFYEKLQYIHRNPVIRGLVTNPPTPSGAATIPKPPATEAPSKLNSTVPHISAPQRPLTPRWTEHLWVLGAMDTGLTQSMALVRWSSKPAVEARRCGCVVGFQSRPGAVPDRLQGSPETRKWTCLEIESCIQEE